jgi:putative hemolysin
VRADTLITDLNDWFDLYMESDEVDTIGGLILSVLGRVPEEKEEVEITDMRWRIEKMDRNGINTLSVMVSPQKARQLREERL